jgi:hypothetical protein
VRASPVARTCQAELSPASWCREVLLARESERVSLEAAKKGDDDVRALRISAHAGALRG